MWTFDEHAMSHNTELLVVSQNVHLNFHCKLVTRSSFVFMVAISKTHIFYSLGAALTSAEECLPPSNSAIHLVVFIHYFCLVQFHY